MSRKNDTNNVNFEKSSLNVTVLTLNVAKITTVFQNGIILNHTHAGTRVFMCNFAS